MKLRTFTTLCSVLGGLLFTAVPAHATTSPDRPAPRTAQFDLVSDHTNTGSALSAGQIYSITDLVVGGPNDNVSGCTVTFNNGPTPALFLCGTHFTVAQWNDGRLEVSGLGTDHAVWNSWQTSPGRYAPWAPWGSLGGHDLKWGVKWDFTPVLSTIGGDNRQWCRVYNNGWGGWVDCSD